MGRAAQLMLALGLTMGCAHKPHVATDAGFSGAAAYARVNSLVGLPRAPDHPDRASSIDELERMMTTVGLEAARRIEHEAPDPITGTATPLTSLLGWVRPHASRVFVLATHFDTPPRAHEDPDPALREQPVMGANDGTSGVAIVLELAPVLRAQLPDDVGFAVILFDGEELGAPRSGGYTAGSQHLASLLTAGRLPNLARAELGIVLDMVGDADLQVRVDPISEADNPKLVEHVWQTAKDLGVAAFRREPGRRLIDDNVHLSRAGIPSILVIDAEFAAWHTTADDLTAVSPVSLEAVGEVVRVALLRWYGRD